jgi:hypothetical protein
MPTLPLTTGLPSHGFIERFQIGDEILATLPDIERCRSTRVDFGS